MPDTRPDLLRSLSPEQVDGVLGVGKRIALPAGAVLFQLGGDADCLYVIDRGRVDLTLPMRVFEREQDILVEERTAGQTLGWSALIPPHRFTLKATARIDSDLTAFPRAALHDYLERHPDVGQVITMNVAATIGQRLQVFQAMWLREMKRSLELSGATGSQA